MDVADAALERLLASEPAAAADDVVTGGGSPAGPSSTA